MWNNILNSSKNGLRSGFLWKPIRDCPPMPDRLLDKSACSKQSGIGISVGLSRSMAGWEFGVEVVDMNDEKIFGSFETPIVQLEIQATAKIEDYLRCSQI
jgi:hypothetical protein